MKKGIFLICITLLLIIGWSVGWFFVSGKVETVLTDTKTKLAEKGKAFECTNQQVDGYPFRISLNCDDIRYTDDSAGITFKAGQLKSAAQAYQPNKAIVELQSPANLNLQNGEQFNTTWNSMRSSLKAGLSGPENISIHGKDINFLPTNNLEQAIDLKDFQLHGRKIGDDNVNLALNLKGASSPANLWPAFDLTSTFLIENSYQDMIKRTGLLHVARTKGLKGKLEAFQYEPTNGGTLEISGPAQVNTQGVLSGNFNIKIRNLPKLINALSKSFPQERDKFQDISGAISLLGNSGNEISIPITVRNGKVSIGILPIASIPPLY